MKYHLFIMIAVLLAAGGCKSTRKVSRSKTSIDSVGYSKQTAQVSRKDSSSYEASFEFGELPISLPGLPRDTHRKTTIRFPNGTTITTNQPLTAIRGSGGQVSTVDSSGEFESASDVKKEALVINKDSSKSGFRLPWWVWLLAVVCLALGVFLWFIKRKRSI